MSSTNTNQPGANQQSVAPAESVTPIASPATRLLLISEQADLTQHLQQLLGTHYKLDTAEGLEVVPQPVHSGAYHLILIGPIRSWEHGVQLIERLRAYPESRAVPIISIFAEDNEETIADVIPAGSNDYVVVPFGDRELLTRVAAQLSLARRGPRRGPRRGSMPAQEFHGPDLPLLSSRLTRTVEERRAPGQRESILVADDTVDSHSNLRHLLGRLYEVETVADGPGVLTAAHHHHPDLIITNDNLPSLDGSALLHELRRDPETATIPVIVLSGKADETTRLQSLEAGADDYLVRPFSVADLVARVGAHLKMARLQREAARQEQQLRAETDAAEQLFRTIFENAAVGITQGTLDGRYLLVNQKICDMLGYSREDLLQPCSIGHPEDAAATKANINRLLRGETGSFSMEKRYIRKDGTVLWAHTTASLTHDANGDPQYIIAVIEDITERKQAEAAVRQAQEQLEARVRERTAELTYLNGTLIEQNEERERAEDEVRRRNKELATLNTITAAVGSSLELPAVFTTLKELISQQMGIPGGAIFLYDRRYDKVQLGTGWGMPPELLEQLKSVAASGEHYEAVIRRQEALVVSDFRNLPDLAASGLVAARPGWLAHLTVPLLAKGDVQGVLMIFSQVPAVFSPEQVTFFQTLGQHVGVAIQNARLFEEVRSGRARLGQLAQKVVSAQEDERQRISHELHDVAGQALTALMINLDLTRANLPKEFLAARENISDAAHMIAETMESIRLLAHNLRPPELEHIGLHATLEGLCHDLANRTRLPIYYRGVEIPELPEPVAISLYRVAQESLTNVARHARANQVKVTLTRENEMIILAIEDDGQGFDLQSELQPAPQIKGIGLPGMRERLDTVGGELAIHSVPGAGTRLVARVPFGWREAGPSWPPTPSG